MGRKLKKVRGVWAAAQRKKRIGRELGKGRLFAVPAETNYFQKIFPDSKEKALTPYTYRYNIYRNK
ncbi:hypothetical protein YDYSY3_26460 [Paenibacillus chitinolyticus]|nr:hypothetical protein YDYSY3_26460 [Paenibacillus chitinolyticus]